MKAHLIILTGLLISNLSLAEFASESVRASGEAEINSESFATSAPGNGGESAEYLGQGLLKCFAKISVESTDLTDMSIGGGGGNPSVSDPNTFAIFGRCSSKNQCVFDIDPSKLGSNVTVHNKCGGSVISAGTKTQGQFQPANY